MTDETVTITRTKFQAGADVPEWIIIAEPIVADAIQGKFTFGVPIDLIDLPDYYLIVPCMYGPIPSVINFSGAGCKIMAAAKPVRVVNGMGTFQTEAVDAWGSMAGIVGQVQAPPRPQALLHSEEQMRQAAIAQYQESQDALDMRLLREEARRKQSFWRRLWGG